jgi:hypothetical protein
MRDPVTLRAGFTTQLLFGLLDYSEMSDILSGGWRSSIGNALMNALTPLRHSYPELKLANPAPFAIFWPDWTSGKIEYVSRLDFQRATWFLFRETWRTKTCPNCSTYFLAQKPPQLYCSVSCSNAAHRASSLDWWKKKGSQRRTAKITAKRREG